MTTQPRKDGDQQVARTQGKNSTYGYQADTCNCFMITSTYMQLPFTATVLPSNLSQLHL